MRRNEAITFLSLSKLVVEDKAPKKIKFDNKIYTYDDIEHRYYDENYNDFVYVFNKKYNLEELMYLERIEILPEENDEKKNLVDLGIKDNEPMGFKFDTNLNRPVLARRCDNYYYAYPSLTGWVYYRSRYLGDKDKEIIDITFDEWAYKVVETLEQEFKQKNKDDEWEDICELLDDSRYNFSNRQNGMTKEDRRLLDSNFNLLGETINKLIKNQKYLKEKLEVKDES